MQPAASSPSTPTMTNAGSHPPDAAAEARWLAWKAQNTESSRRSAIVMRWVFIAAAVGIAGLFVQALV